MSTAKQAEPVSLSAVRRKATIALLIFMIALSVRLLSWHDTRLEVGKVQTAVTADYQRVAQLFSQGGLSSFLSSTSPLSHLNTLGHPPGYSILIAFINSIFGHPDGVIQFVQIVADAIAAVVIFLILTELLSLSAGAIAGLLAGFSPQLSWNSVLFLPDSLAVLPILLAVFCLVRATRNPRVLTFVASGVLVGVSCWLRANAMLLAIFMAGSVLLLVKENRWRFSAALICGALLIVLPLTIRNAIVFHRFIPISLGAGQTLLEGIADYDLEGRFGIPNTDAGITRQEAEVYQRPDYYGMLFDPDGVERERARLQLGFEVVRSHPLWFAGVMARRAGSMLHLERSRLISIDPAVSHSVASEKLAPVWVATPAELSFSGVDLSAQAVVFHEMDTDRLVLSGDDTTYGRQFASGQIPVSQNVDYLLTIPLEVVRGRMRVSVTNAAGQVYGSTIVEAIEAAPDEDPSTNLVQLPFITQRNERVQILFSNEAPGRANPVVKIGPLKLFELGPSRFLWTRYPRLLVHGIQKLFLTAVILPLAIVGFVLLLVQKQNRALLVLMVVPLYFFSVQSIVHTEYRYVLAVDYFVFALAAVSLARCVNFFALKPQPESQVSISSHPRTSLSALR